YQAGVPVTEEPKGPLEGGLAVGKSPEGKALKFIHRGSYDAMDSTYEAITNFLDEKRLEARDLFVEFYVTDPLTTPEDNLVIEVYGPVKRRPSRHPGRPKADPGSNSGDGLRLHLPHLPRLEQPKSLRLYSGLNARLDQRLNRRVDRLVGELE